jgi:cytochrome d ubiquinol oxidase subunit II
LLLIWFWLVAFMITAYVVLDGFDLGAGILHLWIARTDDERRLMIRTIGPVWDGNEVWLIAGGGTLYFAFPLLYASAFSGFYLPLMIVLWLLILRGTGIELRGHMDSHVWRGLCDLSFGIASTLLAVFFGAALANVIRGVPLQADHYFFLPLWTDWRVGPLPGILDWYTVLGALVALVALALHGANYVALKTSGELNQRARRVSRFLWPVLVALTILSLVATLLIRPAVRENYQALPFLYLIPALVAASLLSMRKARSQAKERLAFLSSCSYLVFMLVGAASAMYPNLLVSTTDPARNITVYNAHSGEHSLAIGLIWWTVGMAIAVGYFVFVYRMFRGKVAASSAGHGY